MKWQQQKLYQLTKGDFLVHLGAEEPSNHIRLPRLSKKRRSTMIRQQEVRLDQTDTVVIKDKEGNPLVALAFLYMDGHVANTMIQVFPGASFANVMPQIAYDPTASKPILSKSKYLLPGRQVRST
jgi:hypothetical protein